MFKKKRSINLSYERQGLIFFTCLTYRMQPLNIQKRIENLCVEVAGEDFQALFALLTCEYKTAERIAADYFIPMRKLSDYRKNFYEEYDRKYINCR